MNALITATKLKRRLGEPNLVVLDCRFSLADVEAGRILYESGHIPGARYVNLNNDMSGPIIPGRTGRHPLPTPEAFAKTLGRLGVANSSFVVAYDDASGAFAARCWWMLRWLGHGAVVVLDGGIKAWRELAYEVVRTTPVVTPTEFKPGAPLTRTVTASDIPGTTSKLLDAREEARFRGEVEPIDPVAGHIPGATCAPSSGNTRTDSRFKSPPELRDRFGALGVDDETPVICYCGSGITAAHNVLALVQAGFPEPALYPGSFSEWITDPTRPVARG